MTIHFLQFDFQSGVFAYVHQQEDAGTWPVQGLYDGKTAAGAGIHPKHLRIWTDTDCLQGSGEVTQPLCGIGCHTAAMTVLVMR